MNEPRNLDLLFNTIRKAIRADPAQTPEAMEAIEACTEIAEIGLNALVDISESLKQISAHLEAQKSA